jgi:acetyl-CoA C-acetyltransferase
MPIATEIENPFPIEGRLNPLAIAHGAIRPIHVYPFYENAAHAAWGQSPLAALEESGELWSRYSRVAANNPYAWSKRFYSTHDVITPTADNRFICHPYTKRMVANPAVNQGAAVLLTTLERARALRIDENRLIHVLGGGVAHEPRDYLQRDQYARSEAQDVLLTAMRQLLEEERSALQALELYSCFPCVPKMTRRVLGLASDATPTVTGGLSFFGAPLNGYMNHATCAMVRHLRDGKAETGLLYGQGEFVTKHHAVVVSRRAARSPLKDIYSFQATVDHRRGPIPALISNYEGLAAIETYTVVYDRDGTPLHGIVIARTPECRVMGRVPAGDRDTLNTLINKERSPIGLNGMITFENVSPGGETLLQFRL